MKLENKKFALSFTVDVTKWRCGGSGKNKLGKGETLLRNGDGYMCCLGFACLAAGATALEIKYHSMPYRLNRSIAGLNLPRHDCKYVSFFDGAYCNTVFAREAQNINDDQNLTLGQRKHKLIALGKEHNIEVKFVGEV